MAQSRSLAVSQFSFDTKEAIMSEEKQIPEPTKVAPAGVARRRSRSLFAPIVLIAAGVIFLLQNLGLIGALEWQTALQLWPLALIFLGLNVLATQFRPPLGTALSGLVAVAAVAVFGFLLVRGMPAGAVRALGLPQAAELHEAPFSVPAGAAESAEVVLDMENYPARIEAGSGRELLSGAIWTRTGVDLSIDDDDPARVEVEVGEERGGPWFNIGDWVNEGHTWEFYLSPAVALDLRIDGGNAPLTAELGELSLGRLRLDAGNGPVSAVLPGGEYEARVDGGNGGIDLTLLPGDGRRVVRIDNGNGGVSVRLPEGVEARVEYEQGNGAVDVDGRFTRVSGRQKEGAYETAGYDAAGDGVLFVIETGNGSVTITD